MILKLKIETEVEVDDEYPEFCLPTCKYHYGANRCALFEVRLGLDTHTPDTLLFPVRCSRCLCGTGTPSTLDPYRP
jgi:hypothetical protein